MPAYELTREVWLYQGKGGRHFVTLPAELADDLRVRHADAERAFGSLRVRASLGSSTSLFTEKRSASYLLPVKAEVRREQLVGGDTATILTELAG
jgi:hypothetical protein